MSINDAKWIDQALAVFSDPSTSSWLLHALTVSLRRDVCDAATDAGVLADVLNTRAMVPA